MTESHRPKKIDVPLLIVHGGDDQMVPFEDSASLAAKLVKSSVSKVYPGAPHGLPMTLAERFDAGVPSFIKG